MPETIRQAHTIRKSDKRTMMVRVYRQNPGDIANHYCYTIYTTFPIHTAWKRSDQNFGSPRDALNCGILHAETGIRHEPYLPNPRTLTNSYRPIPAD